MLLQVSYQGIFVGMSLDVVDQFADQVLSSFVLLFDCWMWNTLNSVINFEKNFIFNLSSGLPVLDV